MNLFSVPMMLLLLSLNTFLFARPDNTLTPAEHEQGWLLLYDGATSQGWQSLRSNQFPAQGWEFSKGELTVQPGGKGGDIITTATFGNFELVLDVKLTKGANSGIKYFIQDGSSIGCEYQILDDANHPDANQGVNNNRKFAALYDLIPTGDKTVNPLGEWNHVRIIVQDGQVEHWLNGAQVLAYDRFSACFRQLVLHSKFKNEPKFATWQSGHILLQDHGDKVAYKNIKIRNIVTSH